MKRITTLVLTKLVVLAFCCNAILLAQNSQNKLYDEIKLRANQEYAALEQLYKHLHTNPELSFYEEKTAARIAEELAKAGFAVTRQIGGHGVGGVLKNGNGPTILVRTDLDALPITENTGLAYASKVRVHDNQNNEVGVMHACGHDIHMSSFIGTARLLSQLKDKWRGTLIFLGQPAEERGSGARAVLQDGLFTQFPKPDYCVAWHVASDLPAGTVGYCEGYALANVNSVDVTIRGVGGHGAYPHTTKDPIVIAAETIMLLQTIVSREIKPIDPAVVTVGSIHGGAKHNIIPDEVQLQLTVRSYSDHAKEQTLQSIARICNGVASAAGVPENRMPIVKIADEYTPSVYNDPGLVKKMVASMKNLLGDDKVAPKEPVMGGEDFSEYGRTAEKIPLAILWLGTISNERVQESWRTGKALPSLHSSEFAPLPEPTIKTGVTAMTAAVLDLLNGN